MPNYIVGEIIAERYRLIQPLAEGGMGALWVAQNLALDVPVALKLIRSEAATPGAAERLLQEARAAARLKHPSIVRIFDFGRTRHGDPFIVMELLAGESLGELLEREGRLLATYAVQLLLPIAEGLAVAHKQAIVHRDLKPDNVFLAQSDAGLQPKIVDFGIAKLTQDQLDTRLTQAGTVLGSPDYMSPEQARGIDDLDHRTDIWAFCIVLYEAITGRVPFEETNYNALLRQIIEDPVPSILGFAAGDADLWAILDQGLRKDRTERWQSVRDLGEALACWLIARGVTEDVYGHSLRAGWLDPRQSMPDHFRSGARKISNASPPLQGPTLRPGPASSRTNPMRPVSSASLALPGSRPLAKPLLDKYLPVALGAIAIAGLFALGLSLLSRVYREPETLTPSAAASARRTYKASEKTPDFVEKIAVIPLLASDSGMRSAEPLGPAAASDDRPKAQARKLRSGASRSKKPGASSNPPAAPALPDRTNGDTRKPSGRDEDFGF